MAPRDEQRDNDSLRLRIITRTVHSYSIFVRMLDLIRRYFLSAEVFANVFSCGLPMYLTAKTKKPAGVAGYCDEAGETASHGFQSWRG